MPILSLCCTIIYCSNPEIFAFITIPPRLDLHGKDQRERCSYDQSQLRTTLKIPDCRTLPQSFGRNSRVTNIWTDATNWIEDFSPRSEKAGMEYLAWILLPDQFSAFLRKNYYPVRKSTSLPFPSKITTKLKAGSAPFKACYF